MYKNCKYSIQGKFLCKNNIIEKFSNLDTITKIIHRTLLWDKEIPENIIETVNEVHEKNKDWKVKLWRDDDVRKIAKKLNLLNLYDNYKKKIQKADLARLLIIYECGGCYLDFDAIPNKNLTNYSELLEKSNKTLSCVVEICFKDISNKYEKYCNNNKISRSNANLEFRNNILEAALRVSNYFFIAKKKVQLF